MPKIDWYKSCAYNEPQKHLFHREAWKRLQALTEALCLPRSSYSIRSNKAGIAVMWNVKAYFLCSARSHSFVPACTM